MWQKKTDGTIFLGATRKSNMRGEYLQPWENVGPKQEKGAKESKGDRVHGEGGGKQKVGKKGSGKEDSSGLGWQARERLLKYAEKRGSVWAGKVGKPKGGRKKQVAWGSGGIEGTNKEKDMSEKEKAEAGAVRGVEGGGGSSEHC